MEQPKCSVCAQQSVLDFCRTKLCLKHAQRMETEILHSYRKALLELRAWELAKKKFGISLPEDLQ